MAEFQFKVNRALVLI